MSLTDLGSIAVTLQMRRELGWVDVGALDVAVPLRIIAPVGTGESARENLRAWLHFQMHRALARGRREPGVYRVQLAGETVADRWTGMAVAGCMNQPEHVVNCGLYACPIRMPAAESELE
jgi:hypothetical protein